MVSLNRLDWLLKQVLGGRSTAVRFSFNAMTSTEKIVFTLDPGTACLGTVQRPVVLGALASLREVMADHIVTDKGHSHKSLLGKTVVAFWVKSPLVQPPGVTATERDTLGINVNSAQSLGTPTGTATVGVDVDVGTGEGDCTSPVAVDATVADERLAAAQSVISQLKSERFSRTTELRQRIAQSKLAATGLRATDEDIVEFGHWIQSRSPLPDVHQLMEYMLEYFSERMSDGESRTGWGSK